jgi:hypothetical protein
MANIVGVLGPLPQEVGDKWEKEHLQDYIECLLEHGPFKLTSLENRMVALVTDPPEKGFTAEEIVDLEFLLIQMLQYQPVDRCSADTVVASLPASWSPKPPRSIQLDLSPEINRYDPTYIIPRCAVADGYRLLSS